jgi:hypothetical protein
VGGILYHRLGPGHQLEVRDTEHTLAPIASSRTHSKFRLTLFLLFMLAKAELSDHGRRIAQCAVHFLQLKLLIAHCLHS